MLYIQSLLSTPDADGRPPLCAMALVGFARGLDYAAALSVDPNVTDGEGNTPLIIAAEV